MNPKKTSALPLRYSRYAPYIPGATIFLKKYNPTSLHLPPKISRHLLYSGVLAT